MMRVRVRKCVNHIGAVCHTQIKIRAIGSEYVNQHGTYVPGRWVRWIGCSAVSEAERALCGEDHLKQA